MSQIYGVLLRTLQEVHPTVTYGLARIYDVLRDHITFRLTRESKLLRMLLPWARRVGLYSNLAVMMGRVAPRIASQEAVIKRLATS